MFFRRGHEILHSVLPPKFEHVILVRNSPVQEVLYDLNMLQTQEQQKSGTIANIGPLKAFAVCSKVIVKHAVHVYVHVHLSFPSISPTLSLSLSLSLSPNLSLSSSLSLSFSTLSLSIIQCLLILYYTDMESS